MKIDDGDIAEKLHGRLIRYQTGQTSSSSFTQCPDGHKLNLKVDDGDIVEKQGGLYDGPWGHVPRRGNKGIKLVKPAVHHLRNVPTGINSI